MRYMHLAEGHKEQAIRLLDHRPTSSDPVRPSTPPLRGYAQGERTATAHGHREVSEQGERTESAQNEQAVPAPGEQSAVEAGLEAL
jgi:hypothetical protein